MARLDAESESILARKLESCGTPIRLTCTHCGQSKEVEKGCGQKWCPVCVRKIAAKRAAKYQLAVSMMQWPLFITLTVPHTDDPPLTQLRRLRRAFGKLRRKKLWTDRTTGGVAGLEVTSCSGAFHPHLHIVIDCRWLSHFVPTPQRGDSKARIKAKCLAASEELGLAWAKCLGIKSLDPEWCGVIFKVKRCDPETIGREILKYSIKGSDLIETEAEIGPVIRALQCTRLVTSFGSCFGKKRLDDGAKPQPRECLKCGHTEWMSSWEENSILFKTRRSHGLR